MSAFFGVSRTGAQWDVRQAPCAQVMEKVPPLLILGDNRGVGTRGHRQGQSGTAESARAMITLLERMMWGSWTLVIALCVAERWEDDSTYANLVGAVTARLSRWKTYVLLPW